MATAMDSQETPLAQVGLTLLSNPSKAVIDIVFVHGLQGHPQKTWTLDSKSARKSSAQALSPSSKVSKVDKTRAHSSFRLWPRQKHTEPSGPKKDVNVEEADVSEEEAQEAVFWPKDLLKEDFPQARVMTFGYNTVVTKGYYPAHQGNIFSHARDLLYALEAKRRSAPNRDLVFVAHSLGGIIVKEVLRRSEIDPDSKINKIYMSTTGIFFFGTPHRGSKDWATFGEGIAVVAGRLLGVDVNDKVIHALLPTSSELELCRESFAVQWVKKGERLMVRTFQESKGVTGIRWGGFNQLIVPPDSSTLDHPNQRARTIDADHIEMVKFSGKNDWNYEMVRCDIEELVIQAAEVASNFVPTKRRRIQQRLLAHVDETIITANESRPSYYLPLSRNYHFIGRSVDLDELTQKLLVDKKCQKMAVFGLGGIGKTQVVLKFAYSVKKEYPERSIFWLPALSLESFEQACAEIVRILGVPHASNDKKDVKELVREQLSARIAQPWLLIVDNADDMDVLFGSKASVGVVDYLPESEDGLTIFTSRHQTVAQSLVGSDVLELKKMAEQDAATFLEESLVCKGEICNIAVTTELLVQLDYLPLAIAQAAAYINTNKISIAEYLRLLKNTPEDLVSLMSREFRDNTRYKDSANAVATTWVVSFNQILKCDQVAADLLAFMSCIEWKAIPRSILPAVHPEAQMVSAIGTICSYSFAVKRDNEEVYDIHRLVHLATKIWVDQHDWGTRTRDKAIKHLAIIFPSSDYENQKIWREYLPHAVRLSEVQQGEDIEEMHTLFLKVGYCLRKEGRTREALSWLKRSYQWRNSNLAKDHPSCLASQHALAGAYQANGQVKEAVELLEQVVEIRRTTLAKDHPSRLASQHALAGAYQVNGQVKEALELLEQVVDIEGTTLAKDHPDRLASQHALAGAYRANGQVKEAVELLEQVVEIEGTTLAKDHPDRLASQHALASAYRANGQVKEAVELLEQVVEIRETTLAKDHPDRLASQHALASAYRANGQVEEAVELLEQVVEIRETTLAKDHPARLASQHALAGAYWANGQVKEAVELLEQVVEIRRTTLAKDHPDRLASQHALACAYRANGQVKEAVELLEQVVEIQGTTLAKDHPDRLASQHTLACAYRANGQVKEAIELLEQVVEIQGTTLAKDHPDRLASQHELASAYEANGQVEKAVELLEQVVEIQGTTLAKEHPDRLASQHELASAYRANGQVEEAVELLEQVVKIRRTTLAKDHPDRLASQHALAIAYQANGQVEEAVELLEQVVKIRRTTLAKDHPDRLASQHALASAYRVNGQVKEAVELLEQVVEIKRTTLAKDHPSRIVSERALADMREIQSQTRNTIPQHRDRFEHN